ncbi:MAG: hypothetical protein LBF87_04345 [Treponema sp.]|nr:hypothetical protein [Treponema sp.]
MSNDDGKEWYLERGLSAPLGGAKPYSRAAVISAIAEILGSEGAGCSALSE